MVFFIIKAILLFIRLFLAGAQRCHSDTSLPIGLYAHQSAYDSTSNDLYLFGGRPSKNEYSQSIYKWDINTDKWSKLSVTTPTSTAESLPVDRFSNKGNAAVTINDIVYFIGMNDDYYGSGNVYRFRLSTQKWLNPASITRTPLPAIKSCLT
eukprot:743797_1